MLQSQRMVAQEILIAQISFDDAQVLINFGPRVVRMEDTSTRFCSQFQQRSRTVGETQTSLRTKGVNGGIRLLTHINDIFEVSVAGIVLAICKKQDKLPARLTDLTKFGIAGLKDCVEKSS